MTRCFSLSCQELSIRYSLNQCGVSFILHLNKEVLLNVDWIVLLFKGYIMLVLIPLVQFLYSPWLLIACDFFFLFNTLNPLYWNTLRLRYQYTGLVG